MSQLPSDDRETTPTRSGERTEIMLESATMALYVTVVLLAALVVLKSGPEVSDLELAELVWGTTIGLALAHLFAFRISSRLIRGVSFDRHDLVVASAQLGGAAAVAALCTIPILLLPDGSADEAIRIMLGMLMGIGGYASGRTGGASHSRSLVLGVLAFAAGASVALLKNGLAHH